MFKVKTNTLAYAHLSWLSHSQDHGARSIHVWDNAARQKAILLVKTNEVPAGSTILKLE